MKYVTNINQNDNTHIDKECCHLSGECRLRYFYINVPYKNECVRYGVCNEKVKLIFHELETDDISEVVKYLINEDRYFYKFINIRQSCSMFISQPNIKDRLKHKLDVKYPVSYRPFITGGIQMIDVIEFLFEPNYNHFYHNSFYYNVQKYYRDGVKTFIMHLLEYKTFKKNHKEAKRLLEIIDDSYNGCLMTEKDRFIQFFAEMLKYIN